MSLFSAPSLSGTPYALSQVTAPQRRCTKRPTRATERFGPCRTRQNAITTSVCTDTTTTVCRHGPSLFFRLLLTGHLHLPRWRARDRANPRAPKKQPVFIRPHLYVSHTWFDSLPETCRLTAAQPTSDQGRSHSPPRRRPAWPRPRHTGGDPIGRTVATTARPSFF